jgi:hypothetical protein
MTDDADIDPYGVRACVLDTLGKEFWVDCEVGVDATHKINQKFLAWTGHTFDTLQATWKNKHRYSKCADFLLGMVQHGDRLCL